MIEPERMNFADIVMIGQILALGASVVFLSGGIISSFKSIKSIKETIIDLEPKDLGFEPVGENYVQHSSTFDITQETRIGDVRKEIGKQIYVETWMKRAAIGLKGSQYIIGGLLASSFVQEIVEPTYIGSLGVIVLVSSLINQHFKPEVRHKGSKLRLVQLRALLRDAEDKHFAIVNKIEGVGTIYDIRRSITSGLNQIEEAELLELENGTTNTS